MRRNSVLEELRVNRLAVIQEEISCKVVWSLEMLEFLALQLFLKSNSSKSA